MYFCHLLKMDAVLHTEMDMLASFQIKNKISYKSWQTLVWQEQSIFNVLQI